LRKNKLSVTVFIYNY